MLTEDLIEQIYYLTDDDRVQLRAMLMPRRICQWANRGEQLKQMISSVLGEDLPFESRKTKYVWARAMVAYQMRMEGHTLEKISKTIHKDNANCRYLVLKMQDAIQYPQMYLDIMPMWDKFQNKIYNELHEETTQDFGAI